MKKIILGILLVVALIFLSDRIYKIYSRSNVNSHESIVLLNNQLMSNEIDAFFNLEVGTFNPSKHQIVFSLIKKDGYVLDNYINLPVKNVEGQLFECSINYESVRQYGFYDYEIGNKNIIARLFEKNVNVTKQLNTNQTIAQKYLGGNYHLERLIFWTSVKMDFLNTVTK